MSSVLGQLLAAIREGNRSAFDAALRPQAPALLERAKELVSGRLRHFVEPEDIVQDVLLIAYRKLGSTRVRSQESLKRWLDQVLQHRVVDLGRRFLLSKKHSEATRSIEEERSNTDSGSTVKLADCLAASVTSPSTGASRREQASRLQCLLDQLAPDHRKVLELLKLKGNSVHEAARLMGRSPQAIYKLLDRALESCRTLLPALRGAAGEEGRG
jgi:RNA polymerase sigma factor (sigma-70 family)